MTSMRMAKSLFSLSLLLILAPLVARADCPEATPYAHFDLRTNGNPCNISTGPFPVVQVEVVAITNPAGKVRITVPNPPIGEVLGETWNFPYTGDRINGMELNLGCAGPTIVVLGTLTVLFTTPAQCEFWTIGAGSEVEDCDGDVQLSDVLPSQIGNGCGACFQNCMGLAPYNLYPPDGAAAVPVDVEFTWEGSWGFQLQNCSVRIGTTPDCSDALVATVPCDGGDGIVLDFLQPGTTYYWQASWISLGGGCSSGYFGVSPVQSFTTEGPLAVEPTTWGRIKAIYRD